MQTKLAAAALIVALLLLLGFASIPTAAGAEPQVVTVTETVYVGLTPAQVIWLARLMQCESGIKASAVNPNDLDNTPSWGILQFKDTTFSHYADKYGIEGELMDEEAQVAIVTEWLTRPGEVRWGSQFPACVQKLGQPPQAALATADTD
jgi:hypothetical protein